MNFVSLGKSIEASTASAKFQQRDLSLSDSFVSNTSIKFHFTLSLSLNREADQWQFPKQNKGASISSSGIEVLTKAIINFPASFFTFFHPSSKKAWHRTKRKNRLASRRHARYGAATRMYREREQMRAIRICLTCTRTKTIERTAQRTYLFKVR